MTGREVENICFQPFFVYKWHIYEEIRRCEALYIKKSVFIKTLLKKSEKGLRILILFSILLEVLIEKSNWYPMKIQASNREVATR